MKKTIHYINALKDNKVFVLLVILLACWFSMIIMNYYTIKLLSSTRSFMYGQFIYSRSYRNAIRNLLLYTYTEDEKFYRVYLSEMHLPGYNGVARDMLLNNVDLKKVREKLRQAGNSPSEVNDFLWLGRTMFQFSFIKRVFIEWKEADIFLEDLQAIATGIHQQIRTKNLSPKQKIILARKINNLSIKLNNGDKRLINILDGAIRNFTVWIYVANGLIVLILFGSSIFKSTLLVSHLEYTKTELEKKNQLLTVTNEELDRFVYSASHDLRAPLVSLKGLLLLTQQETDTSKIRLYMNLMQQSIEQQDQFIRDIIDFSRNKRGELSLQKVNLEKLIEESVNQHIFYFKDHPVVIKKQILVKELYSDPVRLKIILNNLISNAIKYGDQEKVENKIKILTYQNLGKIYIVVIDNGVGIKPEFQDRIFDMFFVTADHNPGSGLGLYIAKECALKLNGTISVQSHRGLGTKFTVILPQHTPPDASEQS
ncbi:MAG TPA: HAMP domain-containing sensor histidine kinase [Daejeonella sp.]|nr:HAMP domain-containing sensor histidine kinase [Daejeonella sp.]